MEKTLSVMEAARQFADLVNGAYYNHETTVVLKDGKPVARIVPIGEPRTGKEIAVLLAGPRPRLTPKEAEALEADLRDARTNVAEPVSKWD